MSSSTETEKGITLPCPKCGEPSACVSLNMADMKTFTCQECSGEFTAGELVEIMARWQPVLKWIESAPATPGE